MNDTNTSRKLSFWKLLQTSGKIEIPIIQRDYAQGREDKHRIRNRFLKALKDAIEKEPTELDFVYGSDKGAAMQPLDGQQRLTTLFLLHWYIASKERLLDESVKNQLTKFTYSTRTSSRDFCRKLVVSNIRIPNYKNSLSAEIKNASWFYTLWEKDPTIKAMLIMLDAIHELFGTENSIWIALIDNENSPIKFNFISLADFGLSDDLYIKMNARGKQLSYFENLKADIIKLIGEEGWESETKLLETFSHKADTEWTDMFWNEGRGEKTFDTAFINFISNSVMSSWVNRNTKIELKEARIQAFFNNAENVAVEDVAFDEYKSLYNELNIYRDFLYEEFNDTFPYWTLIPTSGSIFGIITEGKATYPQRVLFYAQTKYLLKNPLIDITALNDWLRVSRNIIINSTIDSVVSFSGAINLINELSIGCSDIYSHLKHVSVKSNFASAQVNEEIEKAALMTKENKAILFEAEDTEFCKGKIEILLYAAENKNEPGTYDFNRLQSLNQVVKNHLNGNDVTNEFRRAMLTIGNNEFYTFWDSWTSAIRLTKYSLIKDVNDLKYLISKDNYRHYLKTLLIKLTKKTLSEIIAEFLEKNENNENIPNWKKRLIRDYKLLDKYCQSHCIAVPDNDNHCYLLRIERPRDTDSCKKIK